MLPYLNLFYISGDGKRKGRSRKWKSLMKFADAAEVQIYKKEFSGISSLFDSWCYSSLFVALCQFVGVRSAKNIRKFLRA
jgi:hypothetical protein